MKIFETGPIPIHIALTQVFEEDDLELFSASTFKREVENCYKQYTPAQCILFKKVDAARIQHETEMSWENHFYDELCEEFQQMDREIDDEEIIRAYMEASDNADDDYVIEQQKNRTNGAIRRKQAIKHNKRLRANVITYINTRNPKRFEGDCHCKVIINRRILSDHKSKSLRASKIFKKAQKMHLLTSEELKLMAS